MYTLNEFKKWISSQYEQSKPLEVTYPLKKPSIFRKFIEWIKYLWIVLNAKIWWKANRR